MNFITFAFFVDIFNSCHLEFQLFTIILMSIINMLTQLYTNPRTHTKNKYIYIHTQTRTHSNPYTNTDKKQTQKCKGHINKPIHKQAQKQTVTHTHTHTHIHTNKETHTHPNKKTHTHKLDRNPHGINDQIIGLEESEFNFKLCHNVHFRANTPENV